VEKLMLTRQRLLQLMLETSIQKGISLATPITHLDVMSYPQMTQIAAD